MWSEGPRSLRPDGTDADDHISSVVGRDVVVGRAGLVGQPQRRWVASSAPALSASSSTGDGADSPDAAAARVPQPDLANLPALIESATALGMHVTIDGQPPSGMAQVAELAVYRVIQEALTNISRHSKAKNASVTFVYEGDSLTVTILDDGPNPVAESTVEEGRGLLGMHERAALLGGSLEAGWVAAGGFCVRLRLPLTAGVEK